MHHLLPQTTQLYHHEFIVEDCIVCKKREVSKVKAFASMCPILANQFMVSAFASPLMIAVASL